MTHLDHIRIRFETDDMEGWQRRYEYEQEQASKRRQIAAWTVFIGVTVLASALWLLAVDSIMRYLQRR